MLAAVVDSLLVFFVLGYGLSLVLGGATSDGFNLSGPSFWVWLLLEMAYYTVLEGSRGQTIGKMLLKIKVTKEDGSPCDYKAAFIRHLLGVIDMLPFAYILGVILISTSPKKQRLGDRVAHTIVVTI